MIITSSDHRRAELCNGPHPNKLISRYKKSNPSMVCGWQQIIQTANVKVQINFSIKLTRQQTPVDC